MKNVQISQELFIRLVRLLVFEFDEDTDLIQKELEDKIESLSAPAKGLNLITDVAEAPLTVEKKVDIKKSGSTIRKKVVHKSEE